jgi:hypothetical protein
MANTWHEFAFPCPKCGQELTVTKVLFNSEGQIGFVGICVTEGGDYHVVLTNAECIRNCDRLDQQATKPQQAVLLEAPHTLH